jgi:hypothetical protein
MPFSIATKIIPTTHFAEGCEVFVRLIVERIWQWLEGFYCCSTVNVC